MLLYLLLIHFTCLHEQRLVLVFIYNRECGSTLEVGLMGMFPALLQNVEMESPLNLRLKRSSGYTGATMNTYTYDESTQF